MLCLVESYGLTLDKLRRDGPANLNNSRLAVQSPSHQVLALLQIFAPLLPVCVRDMRVLTFGDTKIHPVRVIWMAPNRTPLGRHHTFPRPVRWLGPGSGETRRLA